MRNILKLCAVGISLLFNVKCVLLGKRVKIIDLPPTPIKGEKVESLIEVRNSEKRVNSFLQINQARNPVRDELEITERAPQDNNEYEYEENKSRNDSSEDDD